MARLLISLTAHENLNVLRDQIRNIQEYVPECDIIIHLSKKFSEFINDSDYLIKILNCMKQNGHILINPNNFSTRWGHMFHAHVSNIKFGLNLYTDYNRILLLSSGDLFFRYNVENYLLSNDAGFGQGRVDPNWIWYEAVAGDLVAQKIKDISRLDSLRMSLHEGTFYCAEMIREMIRVLDSLISDWEYNDRYPKEELFFPSLANQFQGVKVGLPIAHHFAFNDSRARSFLSSVLSCEHLNLLGASELLDRWIFENAQFSVSSNNVFLVSRIARSESNFLRLLLCTSNIAQGNSAARYIASKTTYEDLYCLDGQARGYNKEFPLSNITIESKLYNPT